MTTPAHKLTFGGWTARWGRWQIDLQADETHCAVAVWEWPNGSPVTARKLLGTSAKLRNAEVAIDWASSILKAQGARVFVSGQEQPLAAFLSFTQMGILRS